jgi:hypothetical protein
VTVKGDLVLGKLKLVDDRELASALRVLGELTGFTRQIDLAMNSEETVEQFTRLFREKSSRGHAESGTQCGTQDRNNGNDSAAPSAGAEKTRISHLVTQRARRESK